MTVPGGDSGEKAQIKQTRQQGYGLAVAGIVVGVAIPLRMH